MIMRAPSLIKSKLVSKPADPPAAQPPRKIGEILLEAGKLTADQVARITRLQQDSGMRFGDAARQLGFLTDEDLDFAHARQYGYPCLRRGESLVSESIVAAYQPQDPRVETLRALRSQLMLRWFDAEAGRKALAVVSPGRGEGRSWLAANLAVVFSQLGQNTLLLDADMRHGCQHELFAVKNDTGLSSVLSGRSPSAPLLRLKDLNALTILTAGPQAPNPQELLGRDIFTRLLDRFAAVFDVIIIDTPAGAESADAQMIAAHTTGALMVARKDHTVFAQAAEFVENLRELEVSIVGAVLDEFR